jgi:hypothetical protein
MQVTEIPQCGPTLAGLKKSAEHSFCTCKPVAGGDITLPTFRE